MEIKMFVCHNPDTAEENIRTWLQNNNFRIDHLTQSQSEKNGKFLLIISIFYQLNESYASEKN